MPKSNRHASLSSSPLELKNFLMSTFERLIQVEAELGTMRQQLSSELRRAVGGASDKGDAGPLLTDSERGSMRN